MINLIWVCYFSRIYDNLPKAETILKFSELPCDNGLLNYILSSNNLCIDPSSPILITQDILETANKIKSNGVVSIRGPKGCGKSFSTIILFIYLLEKKRCLYLSSRSFDNPYTKTYFSDFLEKCKEMLKNDESLPNLFASDDNKLLTANVVKLIELFSRNHDLHLFIDFADIASYQQKPDRLDALMDCACVFSLGKLSKIISFPSEISQIRNKVPSIKWLLQSQVDRLDRIASVSQKISHITGYTSKEVNLFVEAKIGRDTHLKLEEIQAISGVNPLLLSLLDTNDSITEYSEKVKGEMIQFLRVNLHLKQEASSVEEFLVSQNWDCCQKFIHYASRGEKLTDNEYSDFQDTWMYHNKVTVKTGDGGLIFNFPGLGSLLVTIFRKFLPDILSVKQLSDKHRSVAGFFFEEVFFQHCKMSGKFTASCVTLNSPNKPIVITLSIATVVSKFSNQYVQGCLYELWGREPAIDCLAYVTALVNGQHKDCLAFIQLSLQPFRRHSPLSNVFRSSPKKSHMCEELKGLGLSIFEYYLRLCTSTSDETIILFMYISPAENDELSLLTEIKDDLKPFIQQYKANHLKNPIYFGTSAFESEFHSKMLEFQCL